jgi:PAS domain S-box-containing protein
MTDKLAGTSDKESKEIRRLATVVRDSNDAITLQDFEGRITAWNHGAEVMYGYSEKEALIMNIARLTPPAEESERKEFTRRLMAGEPVASIETRRVAKDGRLLNVWLTVTKLVDDAGKPTGIASTERDITARKREEEELKFRNVILTTQQEASLDGILVVDKWGDILSFNQRFRDLWGIPPEVMATKSDARALQYVTDKLAEPQEFMDRVRILYANRETSREEIFLKDGRTFDRYSAPMIGGDARYYGYVWFFRDITEGKRLEEQYHQAQKMEAVGRLASGVAHDFNNLLMVIAGYAELSLHHPTDGHSVARDLVEIKNSADRAALLTHQLLAFSRKQVLMPKILGLNAVLDNMKKMLERLVGEDVKFHFMTDSKIGNIKADPGQIEQVVMNLVVNARDAMPKGGEITLETANVELGPDDVKKHPEIVRGTYVMLAVKDTGTGMDEEIQRHLFEPFFTTKEQGKGTGLGLATVYGIVKQSNGFIYVESLPGKGATFRLYFPRESGPVEETRAAPASLTTLGGTETLLLVEDDDSLRTLSSRILKRRGYTVLEAANAGEAILACEQHPGPIDLLLTDMVMPKMNGRDLAKRLLSLRPQMPVLYMSGYLEPAILKEVMDGGLPFLPKPFPSEELARKVREVLQTKRSRLE